MRNTGKNWHKMSHIYIFQNHKEPDGGHAPEEKHKYILPFSGSFNSKIVNNYKDNNQYRGQNFFIYNYVYIQEMQ